MANEGVVLTYNCSTRSYKRGGGQIKSGQAVIRTPKEARAALNEFVRVADILITEAEKQERIAEAKRGE